MQSYFTFDSFIQLLYLTSNFTPTWKTLFILFYSLLYWIYWSRWYFIWQYFFL